VSSNAPSSAPTGRIAQIRQAYKITRQNDPKIPWIMAGVFLGTLLVMLLLGRFLGPFWFWVILGVPTALLATTFIFARRAEAAMYASIEGQPGAAASALSSLRSGWFVTPAVGVTKNQDLVHRVLGRPGVILVSEAPASRAANLLANERKRHARYVGDTPIIEIQSGNEPGQVPIRKLQRHVMKLDRTLKPAQVNALRKRLDALTTTPLPIPKGPLPKGTKIPRA
jgi:hypothetical protein